MSATRIAAGLLVGLFVVTFSAAAQAGIEQDMRCFTSGDGAAPIRFEWRVFNDTESNWSGGYVRYKGAKQVIPLVLKSEQRTEMAPGRPDEVDAVWVEIVDGKVTGQYEVDSQGAIVNSMVYTKFAPHRTYNFADDLAAFPDRGRGHCRW